VIKLFNIRLKLVVLCFIFSVAGSTQLTAALKVALANGNWLTPGTWNPAGAPGCGDSLVIPAGIQVTISNQINLTACGANPPHITIYGRLHFDPGNKLDLPCGSHIYVMPGGGISSGGGGGNSNLIEICGDIVWKTGDGNVTSPTCYPPGLPGCPTILPIKLLSFTANPKNHIVDLEWFTSTESNNDHFEVEHSPDAIGFAAVAYVPTKAVNGNSNSQLNYSATHESPLDNINYYRLKQVDNTTSYTYSSVISVQLIKSGNIKFLIYPNPNNGEFTASISGIENNHEVQILLKNDKGEMVYNSSFYVQDQDSKIHIVPEGKISSGIYVCTLILQGVEYKVKVVVS
jgi:hypothetical protein